MSLLILRMSVKVVDKENPLYQDSVNDTPGEVVDELGSSSNRFDYNIHLDDLQDGNDDNGFISPDNSLSPNRPNQGGLNMCTDPLSQGRLGRESRGGVDSDLYSCSYLGENRRAFSPSLPGTRYRDMDRDGESYLQAEMDFRSPRSRYDLACGPSRNGRYSQWDEYSGNVYNQLSPRYRMDYGRWIEPEANLSLYDYQDRYFSPSLRERSLLGSKLIQSEMDGYPSSYTYGMRQPRKYSVGSPTGNYTVSFSSSLRPPEGRDGVYDDVRPNEGSFSNLSSPQPIYSSVLSDPGSINDFSLGRVQQPRSFRPRPQPSHQAPSPGSTSGVNSPIPLTASKAVLPVEKEALPQVSPISPISPLSPPPIQNETTDDDVNYRIDAQAIMQNREERTVVLIRNIPNRYKLEDLSRVIASHVDGTRYSPRFMHRRVSCLTSSY